MRMVGMRIGMMVMIVPVGMIMVVAVPMMM